MNHERYLLLPPAAAPMKHYTHQVNKLVRFNCRQAVNIDIAMFLPSLLSFLAQLSLGKDSVKLAALSEVGSDVIFVTVILVVLYSVGSSVLGIQPELLPFITRFNRERTRREEGDDNSSP